MHDLAAALRGLTTRGRCFLAAGGACALSAVALGERDLLRVGILLLALPLVAAAVVARTRYRLACSRELSPHRVSAGEKATVTLHLDNVSRLPTSVLLMEDAVPYTLGSRPRFVLDRVEPDGRRRVSYPVRAELRGRYPVGPLSVRLTDPFGFCELTRSFSAHDELVVTPPVTRLQPVRLGGDRSGGGESLSRTAAASGEDDIATRAYRHGDDLRRVHWRSTARAGELMVRREEQPWQSRATVLLDTRALAHSGDGPQSSFEWAVGAAASVVSHLARSGYTLRLVSDTGAEVGAAAGTVEAALLDELAVVRRSNGATLAPAVARLATPGGSGLVVAILAELRPDELARLARVRQGSGSGVAVLLDITSWAGGRGATERRAALDSAAALLRVAGWAVLIGSYGTTLAEPWHDLVTGVARSGVRAPSTPDESADSAWATAPTSGDPGRASVRGGAVDAWTTGAGPAPVPGHRDLRAADAWSAPSGWSGGAERSEPAAPGRSGGTAAAEQSWGRPAPADPRGAR